MSEYPTNTTCEKIADRIRRAERILLITHAKPDGDALGAVLALFRALCALGKSCDIFLMGPLAPGLRALIGQVKVHFIETDGEPADAYDLIIISDTAASSQLESMGEWIRSRLDHTVVLDHHLNGDLDARDRIIAPRYAATTQLIVDLLDAMSIEISGGPFSIAEALFLGLATDTGWFKFSNADADAFSVAARLLAAGADNSRIYRLVEENDEPARLALTARSLRSLTLTADDRAAIMTITTRDLRETGGTLDDLTGLVNEPLHLRTVRVSILLTELDDGGTKISFRSKPHIESANGSLPAVDVNKMAAEFGGGGHRHAAGARVATDVNATRDMLIALFDKCLGEDDGSGNG